MLSWKWKSKLQTTQQNTERDVWKSFDNDVQCFISHLKKKGGGSECQMQIQLRVLGLRRDETPHFTNWSQWAVKTNNSLADEAWFTHSCKNIFEHLYAINFGLHKTYLLHMHKQSFKVISGSNMESNSWSTSLTCFAKSGLLESISYLKSQKSHKSQGQRASSDQTNSHRHSTGRHLLNYTGCSMDIFCLSIRHLGQQKGTAREIKCKQ